MAGIFIFTIMNINIKSGVWFSVLSGLLLWMSWPAAGIAPLLFIALIPLLLVGESYVLPDSFSNKTFFGLVYLSFFIFNLLTTWWIYFASLFGVCMAVVFNSLFMTLAFYFGYRIKKLAPHKFGFFPLIVIWISFEYLHMNWDLSWSWLNLGNGFSAWYQIVQWYEYTGVLGGTLWALMANVIGASSLVAMFNKDGARAVKLIRVFSLVILIPVLVSIFRYINYVEVNDPVEIAVIQPNIDPYNEKFSGMSSSEQLNRILALADSVVDENTEYVVAPETALPDGLWENDLETHPHIQLLKKFQSNYPGLSWVIGMASNYYYEDSTKRSITARRFTEAPGYYDSYNTAIQIEHDEPIQIHHKSKLVPGVERMPYPAIFNYLSRFAIDLGGTTGSLGTQSSPSVFTNSKGVSIAPVICYESVYGDYLTEYIKKGASLIFIITNDGWWHNTPGYRQHLTYASLRAIELRRSIARSANTGISCFVNQRGDIIDRTSWWVPAAFKGELNRNTTMTIYALTGDILGKLMVLFSVGVVLTVVVLRFKR